MHFIGEKMHLTRRYLLCAFLVCALYGLGAMAGTIRLNDKSNDMNLKENNLQLNSFEHPRHKRQTEEDNEEESFEMRDFLSVMTPADYKRDIVFVVDRSWGMGKRDFYLQEKKLVRSLINQYITMHPNYAHIAIVTFAKDVEVPVDTISPGSTPMTKTELFNSYDKPWEQVLHKIDPEISKGTYVHLALKKAREILEEGEKLNRNATKVVVLISDGDYQPANDSITLEEADNLKRMGVFVFTCGLGSWLSIANVRQIATGPTFYGDITDWKTGISTQGLMTIGTADEYPIWITLPANRQVEFCGKQCVNGQCDTDARTGITECRCSVGYYLLDGVCTECQSHTYKDTIGNEECKNCAFQFGYGTQQRGSTSSSQCICQSNNCAQNVCPPCTAPHTVCSHVDGGAAECVCEPGFVDNGSGQCVNEDNCVNNRCQNSGKCLDAVNSYICVCEWGFEGRYCERRINECSHQYYGQPLCLNNGTCSYMQFRNDFICECSDEYQGYFCQDVADPPTPTPAPNPNPGPNVTVKPASGEDNDLLIIIIAASLAGVLLIVFIIIICCCICKVRRKKRREEEEKRNAELDAQLRKGGRYTKKSRQLPKTISQKFSGFWKKKTLRGGMWADGETAVEGAPSAPPKKRPDLLSSADKPEGNLHVVDEVIIGNTIIDDPGSMKGWKSYLDDLEQAGMIKSGIVANIDSGKSATTLEFVENNHENDKVFDILSNKEVNIPMHIQRWEFQAIENDGSVLTGASIGDLQDQLNVVAARTRKYLVILISSADNEIEKIKKEAQYITDHISSEGY